MSYEEDCIFCKIIDKKVPAEIVYEDEYMLAFKDINPKAQVHLLLIPRVHVEGLNDVNDEDHKEILGHMLVNIKKIAQMSGLNNGYKLQINTGEGAGQEVFHLHIHLMGSKA